jgi:hypothetical protein
MAEGQPDANQSQSWLIQAQTLLQHAEQGGAASRLRRARQALVQAHHLGLPSSAIEQLGLESGLLALGQALEATGLNLAAQQCRDRSSTSQAAAALPATDLDALNGWVYPRSLRRYQLDILEGRPLELQLDGDIYHVQHCRADADRNHLLLQHRNNQTLWWWSSGECGEGYRLTAQPLQPAPPAEAQQSPGEPAVVRAGNANFAHFLWNELDPLLRLLEAGTCLELLQDSDTVLNLGQLEGVSLVAPELMGQRPSVRLGGTLVTAKARTTVIEALAREAPPALPLGRPQPLILLGIRGPGRRELRNEVAYFCGLIAALTQHFQRPLIQLDGFTYQHNNRDQPQAREREQACTHRVREIMETCPQAQLENLSGLEFSAWMQRTQGLRFYVTHEGTMQHKLGWLQPHIPGLCLVGSPHGEAIARWHRQQCEGAGQLITLPTDLYAQDGATASLPEAEQHNRSFEMVNIEQAINLTMVLIRSQLEMPTAGSPGDSAELQ